MASGGGNSSTGNAAGGSGEQRKSHGFSGLAFNRKMLASLECLVCLHPMEPPIYQCATGHSFCGECEPKIKKCPICPSFKTKIRNFGLEAMTRDLYYACRVAECNETFLLINKGQHEEQCTGRAIDCWITRCTFAGTAGALKEHAVSAHARQRRLALDTILTQTFDLSALTNNAGESYYVVCDGQLFRSRLSMDDGCYGFCVMLYGAKREAAKYKFEVKIKSQVPGKLFSATYESEMHLDTDFSNGCCVELFRKGSPAEKKIMKADSSELDISYRISRKQ